MMKFNNMDVDKDKHQTVYKIDGDFNGNIDGDNVIVILMGDVNINGNVNVKSGNVVLIRGSIDGNVTTEHLLCPNPDKTEYQQFLDKLSSVDKLSKNTEPPKEDKEDKKCSSCYWFNSERGICESTNDYGTTCGYANREKVEQATKDLLQQPLRKYVNCADCGYATEHPHTVSGLGNVYYDCERFKKMVTGDYCICDQFKPKSCETCVYCHFAYYYTDTQTGEGNKRYVCALDNSIITTEMCKMCCQYKSIKNVEVYKPLTTKETR